MNADAASTRPVGYANSPSHPVRISQAVDPLSRDLVRAGGVENGFRVFAAAFVAIIKCPVPVHTWITARMELHDLASECRRWAVKVNSRMRIETGFQDEIMGRCSRAIW